MESGEKRGAQGRKSLKKGCREEKKEGTKKGCAIEGMGKERRESGRKGG